MNWLSFFADVSRTHATIEGYDRQATVPNERWVCRECHHVGELTVNGKCGRCGSGALQPWAVIEGGQQ